MKNKYALILSILALALPICLMFFMLLIEPEFSEAIGGGLMVGSFLGSILGGIALVMNKGESGFVNVASIIPMCLSVFYLLLILP